MCDKKSVYDMQKIAKDTMTFLKSTISVGQTLEEIKKIAENKMLELGADSFWYYDIGCLIYAGADTMQSVSGKKYKVPNKILTENEFITIDLSPRYNKVWGDYAETIILQNGKVVENLQTVTNEEWKSLLLFEEKLHNELVQFVNINTTFEELYLFINDFICKNGFCNLDFLGNLGHSIENKLNKRVYIEKGNRKKLSSCTYFTFEPHIALQGGKYGGKKERIYTFVEEKLQSLI